MSDVHIGPLHYTASDKTAFIRGSPELQPRNVGAYLRHLESLSPEKLPDLVVCSGDLTSYATEEEMNEAEDMIGRIVSQLKRRTPSWRESVNAPYVLIVPGNHDLDWSKPDYRQKIERYSRMADSLSATGDVISSHYRSADKPRFCDLGNEINVFFYLLDTTSLGGIRDPVLESIHRELEKSYERVGSAKADNFPEALQQLEAQIRKDPGYVDPADLERMKQLISGLKIPENRIKIAVMHHNPSSVPSDDVEAFDAIINAGVVKGVLADAGFDLILHGHRHVSNCTHERTLRPSEAWQQGIFVVGSDSLGCKPSAPFLELSLWDTNTAHAAYPPASLFTISVAEFDGTKYKVSAEPFVEEAIHRPMYTAFGEMLRRLGRQVDQNRRTSVLDHVRAILPHLQRFQSTLVDWGEDSELWISRFHYQLSKYSKLWATDVQQRDSGVAPMFESYLREQYQARLSTMVKDGVLRYSKDVFGAIMRTGWRPEPLTWGHCRIERRKEETAELEIVRIIVRDREADGRNYELDRLNFDHKVFAIPLFVIDHKDLDDDDIEDFAIGFDRSEDVLKSFEYVTASGKVEETTLDRGRQLEAQFRRLLAQSKLKTVDEFLGRDVMISDARRARAFAENYDATRRTSPMIREILEKALEPSPEKAGLDICCGTGNYTMPFVGRFGEISGLDASKAMLDVARAKSNRIQWVQASILNSGLPDQSVDAAWCISALHYFKDSHLQYMLRQVFRLLRKGGVFVADTEFAEQQDSLWLIEFFPSLRQRYANTCYAAHWFEEELKSIGFTDVTLDHHHYPDGENDGFLRVGQRSPEVYLNPAVRDGIPAFVTMAGTERENGLTRLRRAIDNDDITRIIKEYEEAATMPGDLGTIVARK